MVITRVAAENFLKFRQLEVNDLPTSGLIGVTGENESGKSSLGETICFALFGQTFSTGPEEPEKLLRWGETRCRVTMDFVGGDRRSYRVSRTLDENGSQGASLALSEPPETLLAKGAEHVDAAIPGICGFGFSEFLESFYFAQRDLVHPQPRSEAVQAMAGVAPLVEAEREIRGETEALEEQLERLDQDLAENRQRLEDIDLNPETLDRLAVLQDEAQELAEAGKEAETYLNEAGEWYLRNRPAQRGAFRRRVALGVGSVVLLLTGTMGAGAWALLNHWPDHPDTVRLTSWLATVPIPGIEGYLQWLAPGAGAIIGLGLLVAVAGNLQARRARRLKGEAAALGDRLGQVRNHFIPEADNLVHRVTEMLEEAGLGEEDNAPERDAETGGAESPNADPDPMRQIPSNLEPLRGRVSAFQAEPKGVQQTTAHLGEVVTRFRQDLETAADRLGARKDQERQRRDDANRLREAIAESERQRKEVSRDLMVHRLGEELLSGTSRELSNQFNREVQELTGKALPVLTNGRYQQLRLGEGLEVEVFSQEKNGFLDFDEISSGTRRQMLLALRLALSKELARISGNAHSFLFLDEPFAFFDRDRVVATVNGLPQIAEELSQIWLSAQELPAGAQIDREINCSANSDELVQAG